ncbi:MAG: deoxyribodipyrimidine photo-lyase, partial [Burkholderiales bacterium]|nr:deoxyribodipyrimidine photo-lyase [Phycisphaerae bacterium]
RDVAKALEARKIKLVVRHGQPHDAALHYGKDAAIIICDRGYLRHQRRWRDTLADQAECRVVQVESDVVVPVEVASDKHEFAARTIRPKIHKAWETYLVPLKRTDPIRDGRRVSIVGDIDVSDPGAAIEKLKIDRSVPASPLYEGGEVQAQRLLQRFIDGQLSAYADGRNEPAAGQSSKMSMYLHYGHISPLDLALRVRSATQGTPADRDSYIEELIIRRELAMNFCQFHAQYDSYECLPQWAKKTLADHATDPRPVLYSREQLELAQTQDPYWNAAQTEMVVSGFMHNYMRMYWGKKILEWSATPIEAYDTTIYLNNKYELDGRDANSYANIAWIYGLHDRPWTQRPIFGTVRYMNAAGLERKFDIDKYVQKVAMLRQEHAS